MSNDQLEKSLLAHMYGGLKSPGGITISLTIVGALLATVDKGSYIIVTAIVTGGMWALMAMGLALVFGVMNIPNFAHGDFFMIGALVAYFVFTPLSNYVSQHSSPLWVALVPFLAIFMAAGAGAVAGILSELFVFRPLRKRSKEQWVMNSFVLTVGLSTVLINGHQVFLGTDFRGIVSYWPYPSIPFFGFYISFDRFLIFLLALAIMLGFWGFMKFSSKGRAIRAVSQDETGALLVGVHLNTIQTLTLALGSGLAALAGASLLFMFPAYPTVGLGPLYNSFFVIVVVGLGNVGGAVAGGFIVALLQVLTTVYVGEGWGYVVPSVVIVAILLFKPSGIFGSEVRGVLDQ